MLPPPASSEDGALASEAAAPPVPAPAHPAPAPAPGPGPSPAPPAPQGASSHSPPKQTPPHEAKPGPSPMGGAAPPAQALGQRTYAALQTGTPSNGPAASVQPIAPPAAQSPAQAGLQNPTYPYPEGLVYPALHLFSVDDSFFPKQIALGHGHIRIGRQTNNKTAPSPTNGYFDSKVLSRMHAEIWLDHDQVWIKDIKSSNGTFLNGERLSGDGQESEAFALHTDDLVEFGIDIAGEDNHTILHHKVSCKVQIVLTAQDALMARSDFGRIYHGGRPPPALVAAQTGAPDTSDGSVGGMGGVGIGIGPSAEGPPMYMRRGPVGGAVPHPSVRPGGNHATMSFDRLLVRLQSELQQSRETGAAIDEARSGLDQVHSSVVPEGRAPPSAPPAASEAKGTQVSHDVAALQKTLQAVQGALQAQSQRMHLLDATVEQQEHLVSDVAELRHLMESRPSQAPRDGDDNMSIASVDTVVEPSSAPPEHSLNGHLEHDSDLEVRLRALESTVSTAQDRGGPVSRENGVANGNAENDLASRLARLEATIASDVAARQEWEEAQDARWQLWNNQHASLLAHLARPASPRAKSPERRERRPDSPKPLQSQGFNPAWVVAAAGAGLLAWIILREQR